MNKNHIYIVSVLLSGFFTINILLLQSCTTIKWNYSKININIPEKFNIPRDDINSIFSPGINRENHNSSLEVTVYSYTTGYESIRYSGENNLTQINQLGGIKMLLKLKKNNKVEDIKFISITGSNREDILKKLTVMFKDLNN